MADWLFAPMRPGDLNIDPVEREFFATEALGGITDALVRESIQNSLDAAVDDRVDVRFALHKVEMDAARGLLDDLWPHVRAASERPEDVPDPGERLPVLVIEDFGTRGLEGDPRQYEDTDGGPRNDFYYFWRNVGRSRKQDVDRGRWGLGKTVFAAASQLQAFFGLTVRAGDGRALLMGQAVLRIHRLDGRRFRPYGYWGRHHDGLTLPVETGEDVHAFQTLFRLQRKRRPGLSIVVPYPDDEIGVSRLVRACLHHYFHPLLTGRLAVTIEHGDERIVLERTNLERELQRNRFEELLPLVRLARWGLAPEHEARASLAAPPPGRAPRLGAERFRRHDLERLRRRHDDGRRIALDIGIQVQRRDSSPQECRFRLLMERDPENRRGEGCFVRQGITVDNPAARRPRGVRWLLVVDDPVLSAFLGDAENPAHTEWQRSSPKFKEKYLLGPSTLDFVRSAPSVLAALLSRPAEGRDPDLLRELFSLSSMADSEMPGSEDQAAATGEEPATIANPPEEPVPPAPEAITLARVRTGFRIRGKLTDGAPRRYEILAAYDVLRGNPFARYSQWDFRMDHTITIRAQGVRVLARAGNRLVVEVHVPEFDMLVTRFDERRDLRVRMRPLEATA